jgi:tRNA U34 5-methylaminomethyl-2-thiouridine-forming methyltransferase MnmC
MTDSRKYVIEEKADGTSTIYLPELDEHYHSIKGALVESRHIYRDCAFMQRLKASLINEVSLLEIGFGTGLNAVVTAMSKPENVHMTYTSLELYPITAEQVAALGYGKFTDEELYNAIHAAPWNEPAEICAGFTLQKIHDNFLTMALPGKYDVVYFDAFAPEKQPEMWSQEALQRVYDAMNPGGILSTYCAKGAIRRLLAEVGFRVTRTPGPPAGKREILVCEKI